MRLQITAPARLHFGLLQIDSTKPHCYGGLGLLLQTPSLQLCLERAEAFDVRIANDPRLIYGVEEALKAKVLEAIQSVERYFGCETSGAIRVSVNAMPRLHSGLGMGTQLACAVVTAYAGLREFESTGSVSNDAKTLWQKIAAGSTAHLELAKASGRGKRSHIGIEGFLQGGWIFDEGGNLSTTNQQSKRVVSKSEFPEAWQVLVFLNDQLQGLSGSVEQASFDRGQSDSGQVSSQMYDLAKSEILPSLSNANYDQFSGAIGRYNELAGELFIKRESPTRIQKYGQQLGNVLTQLNISAYGQTSWGPTMWAIVPRSKIDERFIGSIQSRLSDLGLEHVCVHLATVSANGASLEVLQ